MLRLHLKKEKKKKIKWTEDTVDNEGQLLNYSYINHNTFFVYFLVCTELLTSLVSLNPGE